MLIIKLLTVVEFDNIHVIFSVSSYDVAVLLLFGIPFFWTFAGLLPCPVFITNSELCCNLVGHFSAPLSDPTFT